MLFRPFDSTGDPQHECTRKESPNDGHHHNNCQQCSEGTNKAIDNDAGANTTNAMATARASRREKCSWSFRDIHQVAKPVGRKTAAAPATVCPPDATLDARKSVAAIRTSAEHPATTKNAASPTTISNRSGSRIASSWFSASIEYCINNAID